MSFDICFGGTDNKPIELQGVHFGPYTLLGSPFRYRVVEGTWEKTTGPVSLEEELAE